MHPISVTEAINRHRLAVREDEASFDARGLAEDDELAARTLAEEIQAFQAMASAACRTSSDTEAKIDYVLNGTVGERNSLLECLDLSEYGADAIKEVFLRSLIVKEST